MRVASPNRIAGSLILLAAAALATACGDPLRPEDVAGTYVLRTIDGDTLPVVEGSDPGFTTVLLADTLRLRSDGKGTVISIWNPGASTGDSTVQPMRNESFLSFETDDGRIEISLTCPPNALCATAGPHIVAQRIPGGLLAERTFGMRQQTLFYIRVREPELILLSD